MVLSEHVNELGLKVINGKLSVVDSLEPSKSCITSHHRQETLIFLFFSRGVSGI